MKLEGYIRVSAVNGREGEGYISPAVQRDAITSYASELGGEIVAWHSDEDFTGGNTDRPGFQAALKRIRTDLSDGIVVMKIDRFARSVADGATIVRELVDAGKTFASCHERIDPATPEGKFMLTAFLANGELFLDQSKAQWWVAKERAIKRGVIPGRPPFGYLRVMVTPTKPTHISVEAAARTIGTEPSPGLFVPHPTEGPIVTELFERAAAGDTGLELTEWMREIAPVENRRPWSASEIRRFLRNRVYLGEVRHGPLRNLEAHIPLTDPATFKAADGAGPARRKRVSTKLPLAGIVHCAGCDLPMAGNTYGGIDHDTPIYRCGTPDCRSRSVIVARYVHDAVYQVARDLLAGYKLGAVGADLTGIDRRLTAAESELDAFVGNLTVRRTLGDQRWEQGITARAEAVQTIHRERESALAGNELLSIDLDNPTDHDLNRFSRSVLRADIRRAPRGTDPRQRITIGPARDVQLPAGLDFPATDNRGETDRDR